MDVDPQRLADVSHYAPNTPQPEGQELPALDRGFRDDLQRWIDLFGMPGVKHGKWLEGVRLLWTHPPLQATAILRLALFCSAHNTPILPGILRRINLMLYGLDIIVGVPIGGGFYLPHTVGTVVMAHQIGRNVTLVSNVTIGMRNSLEFPTIEDNVYIGAGARVLGPVTIGRGAVIGANAVVLSDVPPGATAVGVPARIINRKDQQHEGQN